MNSAQDHVLVSVDVPDPDNFLMILWVLKDGNYQDRMVDIVLSPRPVSFAAIRYGGNEGVDHKDFNAEKNRLVSIIMESLKCDPPTAARKTLSRVTEASTTTWVGKLPKEDQAWFYEDHDLTNPDVIADTRLYMDVSRLRLLAYLDKHNVQRERYRLFTDTDKKLTNSKTILPGLHAAAHKYDFKLDFNHDLTRKLNKAVQKAYDDVKANARAKSDANFHSMTLRSTIRDLCGKYIKAKAKELKPSKKHEYHDVQELIAQYHKLHDRARPEVFVGGPFTELARIIRADIPLGKVYAMGGFVSGRSNLFTNQFNFLVDMEAARQVLDSAERGIIDLTLIPTECAKGSPYALPEDFDETIGAWSSPDKDIYDRWEKDVAVNLFDLLAAMAATRTYLFEGMKRPVRFEVTPEPQGPDLSKPEMGENHVIRFQLNKGYKSSDKSKLKMFWYCSPDQLEKGEATDEEFAELKQEMARHKQHMECQRDKYLEDIRKTCFPQTGSGIKEACSPRAGSEMKDGNTRS